MNILRKRRTLIALALGFTAIPATAMAVTDAVPGDPLKLGTSQQINNASTILTGDHQNSDGVLQLRKTAGGGIGAVLKVVNEGQGGVKRGIDITVPKGNSPISVNPDAGKASGLDADKVDGKSKEDFMPSALYGNGTRTPVQGPGGGQIVSLNALSAGLECDNGDIALSAGGNAIDPEDTLNGIVPFRESYQIEFRDNGAPSRFSANIICMDLGSPHTP